MQEICDPQWSKLTDTCLPLSEFKGGYYRGHKLGGGTFAKVYWVERKGGDLEVGKGAHAAKLQELARAMQANSDNNNKELRWQRRRRRQLLVAAHRHILFLAAHTNSHTPAPPLKPNYKPWRTQRLS